MDREENNRLYDFFTAEGGKLKNYVRSKLQSISHMDAEDIVGDVMLNMFNRSDRMLSVENLAAYAYRALHNKILDYLRKPKTVSLHSFLDENEDISFLELLTESAANAESEAERREILRRVTQAVSRLSPPQKAVFIATEIQGISFRELSCRWKEPVGTLLSRKCRAVKALQEMLKDLKN